MTILTAPKNDFSNMVSTNSTPFHVLSELWGSDLAAKQLQLEHEAYTEGEKRFLKAMERQMKAGEFADNAAAKPLLSTLVPKVAERITDWIASVESKRGHRPVSYKKIKAMPAASAAVIAVKVILQMLTKDEKAQQVTGMAIALGKAIEDEQRFGRIRDEEAKHFKETIKAQLNKRVGLVYKKAFMQAVEAKMLEAQQLKTEWDRWATDEHIHVGIKLIEAVIESTGLVSMQRLYAGNPKMDGEYIELAPEYIEVLSKRAGALAGISPMYQPCVVPPKPWTGTTNGGYWAAGRKPLPLVKTRSRKALKRYEDVYMPEVYESVNLIQNTAWKVNKKVLNVITEMMHWPECPVSDVPKMEPNKPEAPDEFTVNDPVLLKAWKKKAAGLYRLEKARVSKRMSMEFTIGQAVKFSQFGRIWFPMNMDWRGRVYAIPMFNPQGNDLQKGLLTLADGKPIGEEGFYWLKIHGANCASQMVESIGLKTDKAPFEARIKWVEENVDNILASAKDPLGFTWWANMDSPFCFLAFCFEYAGVVHHGLSYNCSLPLAFDGSCSGIQHFSAMLRDEIGGAAVNLMPSETVQDIYKIVADKVNDKLRDDLISGTDSEQVAKEIDGELVEVTVLGTRKLAEQWLEYGVNRGVTKRSVMTLAYGSVEYGFRDQVLVDTIQPAIDSGKGSMFTMPHQSAGYMAKLIWDAVSVTVVAAVGAMSWLQKAASLLAAEVKDKKTKEVLRASCAVHWTTTDGFPVWQEYRKPKQARIEFMFMGQFRMQPTFNTAETLGIDKHKQKTGIAPNFVHSQDGSHLRMTIRHSFLKYGIESFAVIHDSFGTIPADAGSLFKAVRESMVETYDGKDILADFYEQFADQLHESQLDKMPELPKMGKLDVKQILKSDFAFA